MSCIAINFHKTVAKAELNPSVIHGYRHCVVIILAANFLYNFVTFRNFMRAVIWISPSRTHSIASGCNFSNKIIDHRLIFNMRILTPFQNIAILKWTKNERYINWMKSILYVPETIWQPPWNSAQVLMYFSYKRAVYW